MRWRRKARRGVVLAWGRAFRRQFAVRIWRSYFQLAEHDEGEHQMVAAMDGQRMDVPEQLCPCCCHSPVNRFSQHPALRWGGERPQGWITPSVGRMLRKSDALRVMMPWKRPANAAIKTSATRRFTTSCCLRLT